MVGNRTNDVKVYCSFCGKSQDEVKKIIAGNNVFICNECVALSQEIIKEELAEEVLVDVVLHTLDDRVLAQMVLSEGHQANQLFGALLRCGDVEVVLLLAVDVLVGAKNL